MLVDKLSSFDDIYNRCPALMVPILVAVQSIIIKLSYISVFLVRLKNV